MKDERRTLAAINGANVTPDSVRQILFDIDTIAANMNTFNLVSIEDESHNTSMAINVELIQGVKLSSIEEAEVGDKVFKQLADINRDFYNAYYNTAPKNSRPTLNLYEYQTGPFEGSGKKLKHEYVKTDVEYDTL